MPDSISNAPDSQATGQVAAAPDSGLTAPAPGPDSGQGQTDQQGQALQGTPVEPTFFDPSNLPPELQGAYKEMQGAFTKKMQSLSADRAKNEQKVQAYDAFIADPVGNLQKMALQYGYSLTRGQAQQMVNQQAGGQQEFNPESWEAVFAEAERRAEERVLRKLEPILGNVQQLRAHSIENQLSEIDGNWRMYEDQMRETLQSHPSLVNDVAKLYKLSVPDDVLEAKATQNALRKFQAKADQAAKVQNTTSTTKTAPTQKTASTFDEAVAQARETGRREGWYR